MTNEIETPELLPCPFCGSSEVNPEGWYSMTTRVFGPDCVVLGPACDECGSIARTIAAWNTRADLSDGKDKQIEELGTKLAKALRLMELSVELATWSTTMLDDVILFITELKGGKDG